ncbi:ABC transporter ATP-binding protein [Aminobacterium sp. MB27-C1]|jgi:branched-chain amino acid transport system ATP-binding protein|uniref:ABC transporter ATP-binding protein n=1 Tax=Aminobacterium sp. MB27-C1 TaxID=3070661 RepID=UPI0027DBCBFD|nr:ABC transporter ATP-binding protein [Aminobacterium sp. MB27-C1]WMI71184.1 ABC transporter ATP-binding protein [Aminobacterium sp. MB27-C1]
MSDEKQALLNVQNLHVSYGAIRALRGVSLQVYEGEIVCVIGANGAGKSTLMNALMAEVHREKGNVFFNGIPLAQRSYDVVKQGISLVPEGRRVFAPLSVYENLMMGAFPRKDSNKVQEDLEWVYSLFPRLEERQNQYAGTLSGGEQQMLAIGRALMSRPRLLLLDEPSLGLAPIIIKDIFKELRRINSEGVTILLVEQNARQALLLSHRGYVLQTGNIVMTGISEDLLNSADIRDAYLGTGRKKGLL